MPEFRRAAGAMILMRSDGRRRRGHVGSKGACYFSPWDAMTLRSASVGRGQSLTPKNTSLSRNPTHKTKITMLNAFKNLVFAKSPPLVFPNPFPAPFFREASVCNVLVGAARFELA